MGRGGSAAAAPARGPMADAKDEKIAALEKEVAELKAKLASAGSLPGGTPQQPALLPALPAAGPPELDGKTYLLQNVWDRPAETSALGNSKKFVGFTSDTLELQATHDMDQAMPIKFVAVPGKRHTYKLQNMYRPGDGRDRAHGNWVSFSWDGSWLYCRYEKESDAMPVLCKLVRPGIVKMKNCWDKGEHSKWISFTNDAAWLRAVYTEHDAVPLKLVAAPGC